MMKHTECMPLILIGTVGGAVLIAGAWWAIRNSKQYKTMRAVRRTNAVIRRVGHVLSGIADATEDCM